MPATPFDSAHLTRLFPTGDAARLFSDGAEIRAMLLVEGALARVQGDAGLIPAESAAYIHRAAMEVQIDPSGLATATASNGVSVPALVAAFRAAMEAPEHAQYIHWGATSQDIMDTGQMLRLRQFLALADTALCDLLLRLATLAETHATLPMVARTYGQAATPTSFGAVVAAWGWPLQELQQQLASLRADNLLVSLSGAAGTSSALGPDPAALRTDLARALKLRDPRRSWHTDRGPVLRIAAWLTQLSVPIGKLAEDILIATQSDIAEITLGRGGASSTMPQKQNPVAASAIVALARHVTGLFATLQGAAMQRQQRDGVAWFTEWLTFPQLCLSSYAALQTAGPMLETLAPDADQMAANLNATQGLIYAEALSFALTMPDGENMTRPEAQTAVKNLCAEVAKTGKPLPELALQKWQTLDATLFDAANQLGQAASEAAAFVAAVRSKELSTAPTQAAP